MKYATSLMVAGLLVVMTTMGCSAKNDQQAGKAANSDKPIHVVAFDEHDETLQAIIDGEIYGTVVQNPYMYGYKSVEVLKALADGGEMPKADDSFVNFPARQIRMADAADFWKDKNEKLKSGEGDPEVDDSRKSVAFVTNCIDPFWTIAAAGAKAAGKELGVNVLLRFPPKGVGDQKNMLESLLVQNSVTGIAVSPIDPANQAEILNQVGDAKHYITHDSDAPDTNRLLYIGMENYDAGRMAGQLVKEALPDGGSVMIFVGRLGQLNAEQRRQGLIDELLDQERDPTRRTPNNSAIKGSKYTILGTKTDGIDKQKAKQNAQDTISKYPDIDCMVGLFAYNPPLCLQAIKEAGREVQPVAAK